MAEEKNKRQMERFDLELPASLIAAGIDQKARELITSDVCAGGAFFETDQPLPLGTDVNIELILPLERLKKITANKVRIKVTGAVIRVTDTGMAISFEEDFEIEPLNE